MKTKALKNFALSLGLMITTGMNTAALAKNAGGDSGGGGDASEVRVNEIRSDILKWIENGGAQELKLPNDISYGQYADSMSGILQPKKVVIAFTDDKVLVKEVEKTCKGFFAGTPSQANILCNISRFKNTSESEQYKVIHHEYAGLVNVEKNEGAASDYTISSQITDFLQPQSVLKLAVKKAPSNENSTTNNEYDKICIQNRIENKANLERDLQKRIDDTFYAEIESKYNLNKLHKITKLSVASRVEQAPELFDGFSYRNFITIYKVEAAEDSVNIKVNLKFVSTNFITEGKLYKKVDTLGRVLEKGISCVATSIIPRKYQNDGFVAQSGLLFTMSNSQTNEVIDSGFRYEIIPMKYEYTILK
jgi:hypothetical protein